MALKSNSKAVNEAVKTYILENFDTSNYTPDYDNVNVSNIKEVCKAILECCNKEKFYLSYPNTQSMLIDWMQGLPSILDTAPILYSGSAIDLIGNWLQQTEKEKSKYDETTAEQFALYLISRMIIKEAK